jgi:peroxiredoxin Q/BCP
MIKENTKAPDFKLLNQEGKSVSLSDFAGKPLILYFYPKDDTPGCTTEACNFRDDYSVYKDLDVEIVGISPDDVASHGKFAEKYALPFMLLADEGHRVSEAYGAWGKKINFGKEYDGILRTTFLIDGKGVVRRVFEGVKPDGHSQEVMEALKALD